MIQKGLHNFKNREINEDIFWSGLKSHFKAKQLSFDAHSLLDFAVLRVVGSANQFS